MDETMRSDDAAQLRMGRLALSLISATACVLFVAGAIAFYFGPIFASWLNSDAAEAICRRGLEIFILAFLFRLQGFIVTPGAPLVSLFRVDILNIMGPGIVGAGLVFMLAESPVALAAAYAALER